MPALVIIALWVALLAPGMVRWARRRRPTNSIASFHRQLRGLEHSGPKLMEPAFRLEGQDERQASRAAEPQPAAPRLVLLSSGAPTKEPTTMRHEDRYGDAYAEGYDDEFYDERGEARPAPWDDPWAAAPRDEPAAYQRARHRRTVRAPRQEEYEYEDDERYDERYEDLGPEPVLALPPARAKARRTRIIAGLLAGVFVTFVAGLLPGLTLLWVVTLLCVVALVTYLVLMFYASNTGMYGHDTLARVTPVASTVVTPYASSRDWEDDDEDGWDTRRVASAR